MTDIRFKIYPGKNVSLTTLELIRWQCQLIRLGKIFLAFKQGYSYAIYVHGKESLIDHSYRSEIVKNLNFDQFDSIEIFILDRDSNRSRLVVYKGPAQFDLGDGSFIFYRHISRGSKDLVVYFDYSRLVDKVKLHEEFIPKFNFRTEKDILIIGNQFGYWGTAVLFGDNGNFLYERVIDFINKLIKEKNYSRIFFVGGSQGATASLVYGSAFSQCSHIYAACPVEVNKKTMLKHFGDRIADSDISTAAFFLEKTLKEKKVTLYSTAIDKHFDFHKKLAQLLPPSNFFICKDPSVDHGDCLRYYIKDIYQSINNF